DAGFGHEPAMVDFLDEVTKHLLGDVEVRYDPIPEWPDDPDVRRGPPDHAFGLGSHGEDRRSGRVDSDHAWLVTDDPSPPAVHQRVGGAQVNRHVAAQESSQSFSFRGGVRWEALQPALTHRPFLPDHPALWQPTQAQFCYSPLTWYNVEHADSVPLPRPGLSVPG